MRGRAAGRVSASALGCALAVPAVLGLGGCSTAPPEALGDPPAAAAGDAPEAVAGDAPEGAADVVDFEYRADTYDCHDLRGLYERGWEWNMGRLEDQGYEVLVICDLSIEQAELALAYESGLFDEVTEAEAAMQEETGLEFSWYGVALYRVEDVEGFVYDTFVPSMSLENDFGEEGVFTDDFLYFHQPDPEGGPGELRRNLTPDEARALLYWQ